MINRFIILVLIVVTAAGLPTGSVEALQSSAGAMERILAQVGDNAISRTVIMYGSLADLEKQLGFQLSNANDFKKLSRQQQTAYLLDVSGGQVYYSPFSGIDNPSDWQKMFGINTFSIDREVAVGAQPNWYAIMQGKFSGGEIGQALQAAGFQQSSVGNNTLYSLGGDNAPPAGQIASLAGARYNRIIVSDTQIIAAASTALVQAALNTSPSILRDPAYVAVVKALETPALASNTQLVSAAIFSGSYLSDTIITADPLAASVGDSMSAADMTALRNNLGLDNVQRLPRYETAGIGYRRSARIRNWTIALVYKDAALASSASSILTNRLSRYGSFQQQGRTLFRGWKISAKVTPNGSMQVVTVNMQLPSQTDVSWLELINQRDLGFLATE
jgi:hypothetical protein